MKSLFATFFEIQYFIQDYCIDRHDVNYLQNLEQVLQFDFICLHKFFCTVYKMDSGLVITVDTNLYYHCFDLRRGLFG